MAKRIKFIKKYMKKFRFQMLLVLLTILITTFIVAMYPYIFGKLIDTLYYQRNMARFLKISVVYFVIFLINQAMHFLLQMTYANLQTKFIFDLKKDALRKVLSFKGERLADMGTGEIIYKINKDTNEVMQFIYSDVFYGISALLDLFLCIGMTAYINYTLAVTILVLAVITFLLSKYFSTRLRPINRKIAELTSNNESWLFELLNAMRDIRLLNANKYCNNKYIENEKEILSINNIKVREEVVAERCNSGIRLLDTLCIYGISAALIINGSLTLGGMIACIDYFQRISLMLSRLYSRTFSISSRMVSIDRLIELEQEATEENLVEPEPHYIKFGDIQLRNVCFTYPNKTRVLDKLSLHIKPGEKVALAGKSGEGKSTIAALLCRLYDIESGEIKIDGVNIKEYNLHNLRQQIGVVNQELAVFNQSVRFNLIFSNDINQDDKIWEVLKLVKLDEVIMKMPEGLSTILDSSKTLLSGGEKQRLILARMYIKNPSIIILDEATSFLDEKTENDITKAWEQLFQGRTVLIIAHRFSTIINSDRVAYLEKGKILGYEQHDKLLKTCSEYQKLYLDQKWYDSMC
jgi:ATP-binding cassette subfamily B protein